MSIIKSTYYWVGLRSGDGDGDSSAADALRLNYTNWERMRHHEPSGSRASNDDCVLMVGDAAPKEFLPAGSWVDWDCNYVTRFICQREVSHNDEILTLAGSVLSPNRAGPGGCLL